MPEWVFKYLQVAVVFGIGVALVASPKWFTKRDLKAEENAPLAKKFRTIGGMLMVVGVVFFFQKFFMS